MYKAALAAFLFCVCLASPARAASCDERARELASQHSGTVVSVQVAGDKCEVKLLIASADGPPVRRTFVVQK